MMLSVVILSARCAIAGLFIFACLHKVRDVTEVKRTLAAYALLPEAALAAAAWLLIVLEGLAVLTIVIGVPMLSVALLSVYAVAIAVNLLRGRKRLRCGCGGPDQPISWFMVVRNSILAAVAMLAGGELSSSAFTAPAMLLSAGIFAAATLSYVSAQQLAANHAEFLAWRRA